MTHHGPWPHKSKPSVFLFGCCDSEMHTLSLVPKGDASLNVFSLQCLLLMSKSMVFAMLRLEVLLTVLSLPRGKALYREARSNRHVPFVFTLSAAYGLDASQGFLFQDHSSLAASCCFPRVRHYIRCWAAPIPCLQMCTNLGGERYAFTSRRHCFCSGLVLNST